MYEQLVPDRRGPDRRVRPVSFRFPDRRRGFARRQAHAGSARIAYNTMLAAYRRRPRLLSLVLVAVALLNLADVLLTLRAIELGATELNPIMAALLDKAPVLGVAFKLATGLGVVAAIWVLRRYRLMLELSLVLLVGFTVLTAYTAGGLMVAG